MGDEKVEPVKGVEPLTCGLRNRCSASELHRPIAENRDVMAIVPYSQENCQPRQGAIFP